MADPMADGPTEEEMRAYLDSLRAAQPVEVIVQAFGLLATAANVKVGQSDARVMIDGMAALLDATADHVPEQIAGQMRETVRQLQLAQVQAEQDAAGGQPAAGASDTAEAVGGREDQPPPQQQQPDAASRLWIPGRD
jgi:hypothetical protein